MTVNYVEVEFTSYNALPWRQCGALGGDGTLSPSVERGAYRRSQRGISISVADRGHRRHRRAGNDLDIRLENEKLPSTNFRRR
jgi:hypothetical protein